MSVTGRIARTFLPSRCSRFQSGLKSNLTQRRYYATVKETEDQEDDKPVQFSTSKAAEWKSHYTFYGEPAKLKAPEAQRYVVFLSLAVFMVYFCILREENDVDEIISRPPSEALREAVMQSRQKV